MKTTSTTHSLSLGALFAVVCASAACSPSSMPSDASATDASSADAADSQSSGAVVGNASWTVTMGAVEFRSALITYRADMTDPRRREFYYGLSGAAGLECSALAVFDTGTSTGAALLLPESARSQSIALGNFSTAAATLFADVSTAASCNARGECAPNPNGGLFNQGFNIERSCTLAPTHNALSDTSAALAATIRVRCSDATSTIEFVARVCPPA